MGAYKIVIIIAMLSIAGKAVLSLKKAYNKEALTAFDYAVLISVIPLLAVGAIGLCRHL